MSTVLAPNITPPYKAAGKPDDFILRLSVRQYHEMIRNGILNEDEPVELLEGWLIAKRPKNPPLSTANGRTQRKIDALLPEQYHTRVQEPVTLDDGEPEPDVAVARGSDSLFKDRQPGPVDVPLVVEVADASLERDRTIKLRSYARAGIAIYWIVNLPERQMEVYSLPLFNEEPPRYSHVQTFVVGQEIPLIIDGRELGKIALADLLP